MQRAFTINLDMNMSAKFFILGKSNYALSIILDILSLNQYKGKVIVVKNIPDSENSSQGFPYKIPEINIEEIWKDDFVFEDELQCIIGSLGKSRKKIFEEFNRNCNISSPNYFNIIHPSAVVASSVSIGKGVHVSPLSVIAPFARMENFVCINRNVSIGHHTILKEFATVNPGATIAGLCEINEGAVVGAGATIIDKVKIGKGSIIGAGSLVVKDIPEGVVAFGNPAKVIREI